MAEEYKITQKAMEKLKKEYSLVKVDGQIRGLILKSQKDLLKKESKDYFCSPKNYVLRCFKNIGFTLKPSAASIDANFKLCCYGAASKSAEKTHYSWTTMDLNTGVPDDRYVLMTLEEANRFEAVAANNKVRIPDANWVESTAPEVRAAIPPSKIRLPNMINSAHARYDLHTENLVAQTLVPHGVEVVDYDEYLDKSDKPEPSNDQDLNKQLSTTARPGRKLDKKPQANTPLNKPKDETDTFSKTQRPRKIAKSFRPNIKPVDEE
jgi:hypothetical protein